MNKDDGCGIDNEIIKILNGELGKKNINGIGIYNIDKIIKLRYGDGFGLSFDNGEDGGTKVTLALLTIIKGNRSND